MKRVLWVSLIAMGGCQAETYRPAQDTGSVRIQLKTYRNPVCWLSGGYSFRPEISVTGPDGATWEILTPTNNPRDWDVRRCGPGQDEYTSVLLERASDVPCSMPVSEAVEPPTTDSASAQPVDADMPDAD